MNLRYKQSIAFFVGEGWILWEEMSSKREMHQSKYSDFIDVVFDVRRVHVSDSLWEPITLRKVIRT